MRVLINISFFILSLAILSSCGASKEAKVEAQQLAAAPQWVKQRPITNMYYVGVAKINKLNYPDNYRESAKKMALNDLASEISVTIESNSIVSSYEDNGGFKSDFSRYIQMQMRKDLEGYTMKGEYETNQMYMVYYQLSKQKWRAIKAERKKATADRAYTQYSQALKNISELQYKSAIKSLTNALLELKNYWNEPVYHVLENENKERLDVAIRSKLSEILSNIKLVASPKTILLQSSNNYSEVLKIKVINSKGELLKGFPVDVLYRKSSLPFQTTVFSEAKEVDLGIESFKFSPKTSFIQLQLEKDKVIHIKSEDRKMLKFINDAFQTNPIKIAVDFKLPVIYIQNKSTSSNYHYIKNAVAQSVGNKGFIIAEDKRKADLIMSLQAFENKGNINNKIKTAYVSYSVTIKDINNNATIYTYSSEKTKGADYNMNAAVEKSYIKLADDIREDSFNDLLKRIVY